MRKFYGFAFEDGKQTTTGEGHNLRIAGTLWAFPSKGMRDDWVEGGGNYHGARLSTYRECVTCRAMPMGWTAKDAIDYE